MANVTNIASNIIAFKFEDREVRSIIDKDGNPFCNKRCLRNSWHTKFKKCGYQIRKRRKR